MNTGVYGIRNKLNGKMYIGSTAVSFQSRWRSHLKMLKSGTHSNIHLQRAWNLSGIENFEFVILEAALSKRDIVKLEQKWIDDTGMENLYNICPEAYRPASKGSPKDFPSLASPDGIVYSEIHNLKEFAESQSIRYLSIYQVATGARKSYRGWTLATANKVERQRAIEKMTRCYSFISPDGVIHENILDLTSFCKENLLDKSQIIKVHKGILETCKGWKKYAPGLTIIPTNQVIKRIVCTLVDPLGNVHQVTNIREFCRDHDLNHGSIHHLMCRRYSQHKGWRLQAE